MLNSFGFLLGKRAFLNPQREAYVDSHTGKRFTFAQLNQRANRLADALRSDGVEKGERVALLLMNSIEFVEAFYALAKIGAVMVPLNWRLVPDELEFILKDSGAQRLIFGDEFLKQVTDLHARGERTEVRQWLQVAGAEALAPFAVSYETFRDRGSDAEIESDVGEDDMLYIMYTSGTTGRPKGAIHTHETALWAVLTNVATGDYRREDRYLAALPMFHVGVLTPLAVNIYLGTTTVVMRSFDPKLAWQLIERERITTGLMVPAMLSQMLVAKSQMNVDYSSLRWLMTGAAPVPVELMKKYASEGIDIVQVYGMTECCGPACLMDRENALAKPGSAGRAYFHTDVRVVRRNGEPCAPGESGEVLVRARHVMRGYWKQPEATAEVIKDGWLHTGDVAMMDDEGFVYIQDRLKDMIISGGENVYPAEVEGVLLTHPKIREAAVIGQPSAKWGESPVAVVVRSDDQLTAEEVIAHCEGKLARYKLPKVIEFVDEIPRNPGGKVLKRVLRERFPGPAPV